MKVILIDLIILPIGYKITLKMNPIAPIPMEKVVYQEYITSELILVLGI